MRYLLILLLTIIVPLGNAAEFKKINVATEGTITKICFPNSFQGWAVTTKGEVLSTYDAGATWHVQKITSRKINDIDMMGRVGYIAGEKGLLMKSTNGGATWRDISLSMKYKFNGVGIVNDTIVVVCGVNLNSISKLKGDFFITRDAGKNWKKHNHLGNGYVDIVTQPPLKIFILGVRRAFHSVNAGLYFFHGRYEGKRMGFAFDFIDDWGYLVGSKGLFARSTTHGRAWEEVDLGITADLYAIDIYDKDAGVAVGEDGLIIYFSSDGDRFTAENCGFKVDLKTVAVTDTKIFVGGQKGHLLVKDRFPQKEE